MATDALSDVLRAVRLAGALYFDVAARAPWVAEQPAREMVLPKILPGAQHLIAYHVVTEGRCFAGMIGAEPIAVEAGEVVVFTKGDPHVMSSSPGMRAFPVTADAFDEAAASPLPFSVRYGADRGGPPSARLVCGFLACHAQPFNLLLDNLPPVIKAGNPRDGDSNWLGEFIRVAISETTNKRAGSESVLAKLSELMLIEVVRRHLEVMPAVRTGWLAGLRDPFVGKALSLIHRSPGAKLDDRGTGKGCRTVALGSGRAFCRPRGPAADALPRQMAHADRFRAFERRQHQYRNRCGRNRLRIRRRPSAARSRRWWACRPRPGVVGSGMTSRARWCGRRR